MVDDFSLGSLNHTKWNTEIEVGGYGPTLQDASLIEKDYTVDLRGQGCTSRDWFDCVATTNTTNGTIVNPVRSARINTRIGGNIKYGRVEVVARLPQGDWLWPSIMLLPTNNTYGEWPMSGQIYIGGNNIIASTLHFGPNEELDGWWRNNVKSAAYHETFSDRFHKFGVEWTEKYIFTYIDTRLLQVSYTRFNKPFWQYGEFPTADRNGTRFINPWEYGTYATPFDQDFHLVLKVGAGATNGWFEDGQSGKPWLDRNANAKLRFWQARDQWYPTWARRGWMEVKSVKMWQQAPHNGCKLSEAQRFVG
ncbi:hypothetical protein N0V90_005710 [Kalmusia sp. IMI 367209]|nr:hypothetical protein N0V90_005710 [Kalmusia sp. IMI 367209]